MNSATIYTDGSYANNFGVSTAIIIAGDKFLGMVSQGRIVESSTETELLAVQDGLDYVNTVYPDINNITIYTDLEMIADTFNNIISKSTFIPKNMYNILTWLNIKKLTSEKIVKLEHEYGHQEIYNVNKTCDLISRLSRNVGQLL